jgi:hypothetical protein
LANSLKLFHFSAPFFTAIVLNQVAIQSGETDVDLASSFEGSADFAYHGEINSS